MPLNLFSIEAKETWQNSLGLLSTNFLSNSNRQLVMQNGQINNFCIDYNSEYKPEEYRHYSWASDTNCFLNVSKNKIELYRWDKNDNIETINTQDFDQKSLIKLYKYIGSFTQPKEASIVPIIMDLFGRLRNDSRDQNGLFALKSLLYLLAKSNDSIPDLKKWGLDANIKSYLSPCFDKVFQDFQSRINSITNTTKIILRHASGRLFQEAHYQAQLSLQLELGGIPSSKYSQIKTKELTGVHFTPAFITRSIVEESLRKYDFEKFPEIKILDPACGSGEFLKESLRQIIERHPKFKGTIKLYGWDKSATAVTVANFSLNFEIAQYPNRKIKLEVLEKDSLEAKWDKFDIILMNPPFVSWELLDRAAQDLVQSSLEKYSLNRPNLASPFFYKAIKALKNNGILGCVLPTSIFTADSYRSLRQFSLENSSINLIGKLGNLNLFYNAVVDAGIYIAQKKVSPDNSSVILWADNTLNSSTDALRNLRIFQQNVSIPRIEEHFSIYNATYKVAEFPKVISYLSNQLEKKLGELLSDGFLILAKEIFDVKQGARTGANNTFLIDSTFYSYLSEKEQRYFKPVITNKAIKNGNIFIGDYLWFPYGNKRIKNEKDLIANAPNFYKYRLAHNEKKLKARPEVQRGSYNWWELTRERAWQNDKPKLVSTEFGKAGYFGYEKTGNFVVERGYAWLLKSSKTKNINEDDLNYAYLALFFSDFFNNLLALYSKSIAGGQYYLASKFVNSIPIPDFTNSLMTSYMTEFIEYGKRIHANKMNEIDIMQLNNLVKSVYRL